MFAVGVRVDGCYRHRHAATSRSREMCLAQSEHSACCPRFSKSIDRTFGIQCKRSTFSCAQRSFEDSLRAGKICCLVGRQLQWNHSNTRGRLMPSEVVAEGGSMSLDSPRHPDAGFVDELVWNIKTAKPCMWRGYSARHSDSGNHAMEGPDTFSGFLPKVLKHGRWLLKRKESDSSQPCNAVFLSVNLKIVSFPVTAGNKCMQWLREHKLLDDGSGGCNLGGSGNGKALTGTEGAGDHYSGSQAPRFYLVWGLCISLAWMLLRTVAINKGVSGHGITSVSDCVLGMLWLGWLWSFIALVLWITRMPVQLLCTYSPERFIGRIPIISQVNRLRLHESMAKHLGLVPAFALSWFFFSDLASSLKQVIGRDKVKLQNARERSSSKAVPRRRRGGSFRRRSW